MHDLVVCSFLHVAKCRLRTQIGVHGLIINFYDHETRIARNATFLPEVAEHEVGRGCLTACLSSGWLGLAAPPLLVASSAEMLTSCVCCVLLLGVKTNHTAAACSIIMMENPRGLCADALCFFDCCQGWTHQQTVDALVRKSGYLGSPTPLLRSSLVVTRYQVHLGAVRTRSTAFIACIALSRAANAVLSGRWHVGS